MKPTIVDTQQEGESVTHADRWKQPANVICQLLTDLDTTVNSKTRGEINPTVDCTSCTSSKNQTTKEIKKTRYKKRDLSPTTEDILNPVESNAKKQKSSQAEELNNNPAALSQPISGIKEKFTITSGAPNPAQNIEHTLPTNASTPPWAQQLLGMVAALSKEIITLRDEIKKLRSDGPKKSDAEPMVLEENKSQRMEWERPQADTNFNACPSYPNQQYSHSPTLSPPHAQYLNECFVKRIGLQPDERTEVHITTFDEVHVGKDYNRILPTCQGYFIELDESDIIKDNLWWNESPEDGEESWICPGLKIFNPFTSLPSRQPNMQIRLPGNSS